jgi:hypothetical protein
MRLRSCSTSCNDAGEPLRYAPIVINADRNLWPYHEVGEDSLF